MAKQILLLGTRPTLLTNYVISQKMPFWYNERTASALIKEMCFPFEGCVANRGLGEWRYYLLLDLFFDMADLLVHVLVGGDEGELLLQAGQHLALNGIHYFLLGLESLGRSCGFLAHLMICVDGLVSKYFKLLNYRTLIYLKCQN